MPIKRPKLSSQGQASTVVNNDTPSRPSPLSRIPAEILAEILLETTSPKDLLAVARCSKFLCYTLVGNRSSQFIWRRIRNFCKPEPIPDPTPNFTESSYAAFLFDPGNCEICNNVVEKPYASFALRIRLCDKRECRNALRKDFVQAHFSKLLLLSPESSICLFPEESEKQWPENTCYYREKEYSELKEKLDDFYTLTGNIQLDPKRVQTVMLFSREVYRWTKKRAALSKSITEQNEEFAERMATSEGWDRQDLLSAKSYAQLHHYRNKLLENVTQSDYDLIRPELDEHTFQASERRKRRVAEKSLQRRRSQIEDFLHRLKSDRQAEPLPNLTTFRQLPVVKLVQNRITTTGSATSELKSPLLRRILLDELEKWRESAKTALAGVLGLDSWRNSSSKKLHPAERLTARFRCMRCGMVSHKYSEDECLDFAGVCSHECFTRNGKHSKRKGEKREWQADQFVPDLKAISIVSKVLTLCNVDPVLRDSLEVVKNIGARIMCLSCDSTIIMNFQSIVCDVHSCDVGSTSTDQQQVGHCHRHEDMQVSLLPESGPSNLVYPLSYGVSAKLLLHTGEAQRLRGLEEYGCRHCFEQKPFDVTSIDDTTAGELNADATNSLTSKPADNSEMSLSQEQHRDDVTNSSTSTLIDSPTKDEKDSNGESTRCRKPVLFTFDGLRSHCKAKHGIQIPRDEDFFQIPSEASESIEPVINKGRNEKSDSDDCDESKVVRSPDAQFYMFDLGSL